jgi:methylmalonyl-CoA/ethylmalonyl-CoA epimerase
MNPRVAEDSRRLHHVAVVVRDLEPALAFFRDGFGLSLTAAATLEDQGVRAVLLEMENATLELIQPITAKSGVARFLDRRGEGLHHVCFTSADLTGEIEALTAAGVEVIDREPRVGLAGRVCFLHPRALHGVLVELVEAP